MESIAPIHSMILNIVYDIETGISLRDSLRNQIKEENTDDFSQAFRLWYYRACQNNEVDFLPRNLRGEFRRSFVMTIVEGLRGVPILRNLQNLEKEINLECCMQVEMEIKKLPFKALVPLLFFQFPALILILLGPLMLKMQEGIL